MRKETIALFGAFTYTFIIGCGMWYMKSVDGYTYGDPNMLRTLWWVEILLVIWCFWIVSRYFSWREVGFQILERKHLLWLFPGTLIMLGYVIQILGVMLSSENPFSQNGFVALIAFVTLLVGIGEEVMFRGIVLQSFMKRGVFTAIILSSLGFSFLHAVNVFGGATPGEVGVQLVMTFLFGLFAGGVVVLQKNIIPLIFYHFLWDFVLFSGSFLEIQTSQMGLVMIFHIVALVPIFLIIRKNYKATL